MKLVLRLSLRKMLLLWKKLQLRKWLMKPLTQRQNLPKQMLRQKSQQNNLMYIHCAMGLSVFRTDSYCFIQNPNLKSRK